MTAGPADSPSLPESAQSIWLRAIEQIQLGVSTSQTLTKFIACGQRADLAVLIGMNGEVVRYWVRSVVGNELLAVGDTHGPLPLSVQPIH